MGTLNNCKTNIKNMKNRKQMEHSWKTLEKQLGKQLNTNGKSLRKTWKQIGKQLEKYGKTLERNGKTIWKTKTWKTIWKTKLEKEMEKIENKWKTQIGEHFLKTLKT